MYDKNTSGLRYEYPIGLQHVEYNAYEFFPDVAQRYIEMLAFLALLEQVILESFVAHGNQPGCLQDGPAQVGGTPFDHGCLIGIELAGLKSGRFHTGESQELSRGLETLDGTNLSQDNASQDMADARDGQQGRLARINRDSDAFVQEIQFGLDTLDQADGLLQFEGHDRAV